MLMVPSLGISEMMLGTETAMHHAVVEGRRNDDNTTPSSRGQHHHGHHRRPLDLMVIATE